MAVTLDEIRRVATLARIDVSDEEAEKLARELSRILEYANAIRELDLTNVEPMTHVIDIGNVLRPDQPHQSLKRTIVLKQAPESQDGCFLAPKIV